MKLENGLIVTNSETKVREIFKDAAWGEPFFSFPLMEVIPSHITYELRVVGDLVYINAKDYYWVVISGLFDDLRSRRRLKVEEELLNTLKTAFDIQVGDLRDEWKEVVSVMLKELSQFKNPSN